METAASKDIYTGSWRGVQRDWRRRVEDARTPRAVLQLAEELERDGWGDHGKFQVWLQAGSFEGKARDGAAVRAEHAAPLGSHVWLSL